MIEIKRYHSDDMMNVVSCSTLIPVIVTIFYCYVIARCYTLA